MIIVQKACILIEVDDLLLSGGFTLNAKKKQLFESAPTKFFRARSSPKLC